MEKDFAPYEQALALKELGFDEECLSAFFDDKIKRCDYVQNSKSNYLSAPTYSQAFRWFREKYDLHGKVGIYHFIENTYCYNIISKNVPHYIYKESQFESYEEAELECLKKLISIVKEK